MSEAREHRLRPAPFPLALLSLAAGAALFALSCLLAAPVWAPTGMGEEFAEMAADPFAWRGAFPHRVLGPLIAWCLGVGGERYWIFHHAVVVALLALLFFGAVVRGCTMPRAALLAAALCGIGAIKAYKGAVGYADPLTFLLLVLAALVANRPGRFWVVVLLALCNHELVLLFVPWLLFRRHMAAGGLSRADAAGAALVSAAYFGFRAWVDAVRPEGTWNMGSYLDQVSLFSIDTVAMWALLTVVAVISNGPMLVLLTWRAFDGPERRSRVSLLLFVLGVYATPVAALDVWRFAGLLLVPLFFAGIELVQRRGGPWLLAGLGAATMATSDLQFEVFLRLVQQVVVNDAKRVAHIVPAVIADLWPWFVGYGVGVAALGIAGWFLSTKLTSRVPAAQPGPRLR